MNRVRARPHTSEYSSSSRTSATDPSTLAHTHPSPAIRSILPRIPFHSASIRSHSPATPARFDSNSPPSPPKSGVANCTDRTPNPTVSTIPKTAVVVEGSPFPPWFHAFRSPVLEAKPRRDDANRSGHCPAMPGFPASEAARRV